MTRSTRRSPARSTRHNSGSGGFALIEALVASVVLGLVGTAAISGVFAIVKTDAGQRSRSEATVVARNFEGAVASASYRDCGTTTDYSPGALGVTIPATASLTVESVRYWNGTTPPTGPDPTPTQWATAFTATCASGSGLQRIIFSVTSTAGGHSTTIRRGVLKRFNGSLPEPPPDPPPGGRECVITATNVGNTWVNEDSVRRNTNYSTDTALNILYLGGTRRFSYLKFAISPGMTCDNGVQLPIGANIVAAEMQLFTFNIGGLPACGIQACWHVLERVPSTWDPTTLTWNNQPCATTPLGASCQGSQSDILFQHGTGAFDWSPRFQRIRSTQLLSDVKAFYSTPTTNFGWVLKEACAITYGKDCGSATPGFQIASSRYTDVSKRPVLRLYF